MPKKDCTELAQVIFDLAMNIAATTEGIENFDDVVAEMQKVFPILSREEIARSMVEANSYERKQAGDLANLLNQIKRQSRGEVALTRDIDSVIGYIEQGELPQAPKARAVGSETMQQLRRTRDNLKKWLKTGDPAMQKTMQEKLARITEKIEAGDIVLDAKRTGQLHESLQAIQDQIDEAKTQLATARQVDALQRRIDELQGHLDAGTVPQAQPRSPRGTGPMDQLRNIRDDLKKKLSRSEPAVKARLEKQIAALEARLESGDVMPTTRIAELPRSAEMDRLVYRRNMLRADTRRAIAQRRPKSLWSKAGGMLQNVVPIRAGFDFSAVCIQNSFFRVSHPVVTLKNIERMFEAFADGKRAVRINQELIDRPSAPMRMRAGVHLSAIEGVEGLTAQEEAYRGSLVERFPVIRNFARAFPTFLNCMKADMFDVLSWSLSKTGEATDAEARQIGILINEGTGHGSLGKRGSQASPFLRMLFWAPKLVASRFQIVLGHPLWSNAIDPSKGLVESLKDPTVSLRVRTLIAKEYLRFGIGLAAIYAMYSLAGWELPETDPRSSDFLKLRKGNVRLDPTGGLAGCVTLLARLILGESKSTKTGKVSSLRGEDRKWGGRDIEDVVNDFLEFKLNPVTSAFYHYLTQEKPFHEGPITIRGEALESVTPLALSELFDVAKEMEIPEATFIGMMILFGERVQVYKE